MPVSTEIRAELDLTIFTATGTVPFSEQMHVLKSFYEGSPTGNVIWDFTRAGDVAISNDELRTIVQYTRKQADRRPSGTTALVVNTDLKYGLARMASTFAELEETPWEIKLFENLDTALEWIQANRQAGDKQKLS